METKDYNRILNFISEDFILEQLQFQLKLAIKYPDKLSKISHSIMFSLLHNLSGWVCFDTGFVSRESIRTGKKTKEHANPKTAIFKKIFETYLKNGNKIEPKEIADIFVKYCYFNMTTSAENNKVRYTVSDGWPKAYANEKINLVYKKDGSSINENQLMKKFAGRLL